jgi:hypothetical protein
LSNLKKPETVHLPIIIESFLSSENTTFAFAMKKAPSANQIAGKNKALSPGSFMADRLFAFFFLSSIFSAPVSFARRTDAMRQFRFIALGAQRQ